MFEDLLNGWDGEEAVIRYDADSGAWMFVCIHSTALGPGGGGTRLRVYPTAADGLADAMRLSGAMTRKFAAADIPRGGAKGGARRAGAAATATRGGGCCCATATSSPRSAARTARPAT